MIWLFFSEKKKKVNITEEENVAVPEAVAREPTQLTIQAEVHRPGRYSCKDVHI